MADITKCTNETCLSKSTCYRFTAKDHEFWQSYSPFGEENNISCINYIKDEKYE